jgi:hypothetical protein
MRDEGVVRGRKFGLRPIGYRRSAVDGYIAELIEANQRLQQEVARLYAAEPLARLGDDVAGLLGSFAEVVSARREEAVAHAGLVRLEADAYAKQAREAADTYAEDRKMEADQLVGQSQAHARARANAIIAEARDEVASLVREQMTIGEALERVAVGIDASRDALARLVRRDDGEAGPRVATFQPPPVALASGGSGPVQAPPPEG